MSAWTHVAGWVLVHFVWQGAVLALAAALALRLCRRQAASVRYVIACGAMTTMLSGVVATAALVNPPEPGGEAAAASSQSRLKGRIDVLLPIEMRNTPTSAKASGTATVEAVLPWIVPAWLFGVTVLLARACAGWWRVRCLYRVALSSTHSTWQAAGNRIASRLGPRRVMRVVQLPHLDVPLVIGCLRPIVVLPIAAISQLDVAQVEAILAHELAHVRRHDYLVNLMQTLAETLLFYHPGVWWLSARIREEREHCCDDVAVAVCGDPVGYAAALTELEAGRSRQMSLRRRQPADRCCIVCAGFCGSRCRTTRAPPRGLSRSPLPRLRAGWGLLPSRRRPRRGRRSRSRLHLFAQTRQVTRGCRRRSSLAADTLRLTSRPVR